MTRRSVSHAMFTIERRYDVPPARVFAAWADPKLKSKWFTGPEEWESGAYSLDFRVGGTERSQGGPPGGTVHRYNATFQDIVPNERLIASYDMHLDDRRISVSLITVEFLADGKGTRLKLTEQDAFLDGFDDAGGRERGTNEMVDAFGRALKDFAQSNF